MRDAILQTVVEVPMSRRQVRAAMRVAPSAMADLELGRFYLSGHSILRGLTFLEMVFTLPNDVDLPETLANFLAFFVIEAEGAARGGESEEFAIVMAECFWIGQEHLPESVMLDGRLETLGIGGTNHEVDMTWAAILNKYYNPARRREGEVKIRRVAIP